jgi:hypothetical protein
MNTIPYEFDIRWFHTKFVKGLETECWEWKAGKTSKGYGLYRYDGQNVYAHRFAYMLANPNFNQALCVCHKCDNRGCVNPSHMFLGTITDNDNDKVNKKRQARGQRVGGLLSEKDIIAISLKYKEGKTQNSLAREFGVNQSQISRIVNRRRWGHIPLEVGMKIA